MNVKVFVSADLKEILRYGVRFQIFATQRHNILLEQGCFTSHLLSFDNNKVIKSINWIC